MGTRSLIYTEKKPIQITAQEGKSEIKEKVEQVDDYIVTSAEM